MQWNPFALIRSRRSEREERGQVLLEQHRIFSEFFRDLRPLVDGHGMRRYFLAPKDVSGELDLLTFGYRCIAVSAFGQSFLHSHSTHGRVWEFLVHDSPAGQQISEWITDQAIYVCASDSSLDYGFQRVEALLSSTTSPKIQLNGSIYREIEASIIGPELFHFPLGNPPSFAIED